MRVEELKQQFPPEQFNFLIQKRVEYLAEQQTNQTLRDIKLLSGGEAMMCIGSYEARIEGVSSALSKIEKWNFLEKELSLPLRREFLNEKEIERAAKNSARIRILSHLGFTFEENKPFNLQTIWQNDTAGSTSFQFAQSPKERNMFLVRTTIPKGISSTITENLVSAPNEEMLRIFWSNYIGRDPVHSSSTAKR